jgi:hypothetical protein
MRKLALILFLTAFIAPVVMTWTSFEYQREKVRKSVKRMMIDGLKSEDLVFLSFSNDEKSTLLKWKHSKEFEYMGEMYDIVEFQMTQDSVHYWCWWDYEETQLNKKLSLLVSKALGHDRTTKDRQDQLTRFFHTLYIHDLFNWSPIIPINEVQGILYSENLYTLFLSPPTPPPRIISTLLLS